MSDAYPILIGIDGGGTSCRAALVCRGVRHDISLGPANVSTAFDAAIATIHQAVDQLGVRANLLPRDLADAPAHLGLAGVMSEAIAARVAAALPLCRIAVTDDRPTTIAGALGSSDGHVAAIGTGSFIGRQAGGKIDGIGGWGFYLGDQAAGAWLMRRCLEETLLSVDGLRPDTGLTRAMLAEHGGDPGRIVLFSISAKPADYARLARRVVEAAEAGDALGRALLDEGTAYVGAALAELGWRKGGPVVFSGGLGPAYARHLGVPLTEPKGTALDGALALAAGIGT
jgi:glucosamine kinase